MTNVGGEMVGRNLDKITIVSLLLVLTFSSFPRTLAYDAIVEAYTDKTQYPYFRQPVDVYGQILNSTGQPVGGGIVAIQVSYPNQTVMLVRTVPTGSNATFEWDLEILSATPCDKSGNPKNIFTRGSSAYFNVTARNNRFTSKYTVLTVTTFDPDSTPLDIVSIAATVAGQSTFAFIAETSAVPTWCSTGIAKVYVSALSQWPSAGGHPYCPEGSANFTITSGGYASSSYVAYGSASTGAPSYSMTFRLSPFTPIGKFDVRVGAFYNGFTCLTNTSFVTLSQELGDIDFDHDIDLYDAVSLLSSYGARNGDPSWEPTRDLYPNGKIDVYDAVILLSKYGSKY
jgi:hypothetical protein